MSDKANKKHRRELKRKQKQLQRRKELGQGPYHAFARSAEIVECLINPDWRERGQLVPFILLETPDGRYGFVTFMIDTWCAGLKDTWGKLDVTGADFDAVVDNMAEQMGVDYEDAEVEFVHEVVLGSVRFAHDNGFRLPAKWERWCHFVGETTSWPTARLTEFGYNKEGKRLMWCAPMFDLRNRLIGCTVEEFLARPDVGFMMEVSEDELDPSDAEPVDEYEDAGDEEVIPEFEQVMDEVKELLSEQAEIAAEEVAEWCEKRNIPADSQLPLAMNMMLRSLMRASLDPDLINNREELHRRAMKLFDDGFNILPAGKQIQFHQARSQVRNFMTEFSNADGMIESLGIAPQQDV